MKRTLWALAFIFIFSFHFSTVQAQDLEHFKRVTKELCSSKYQGRGYAQNGANLAGKNEDGDTFKYYHTTFDNYEHLLTDTYEPLFHLITDVVELYNIPAELVAGHYTYQHAFEYDLFGSHLNVHETGTMDFYLDGNAIDSARQVYVATLENGDKVTWVFNYVSPSRWSIDGEDFYFAGIKDSFRMELIEGELETELAQKIINVISGGIDYEYKFHIDTLTSEWLKWSFIYRDGHSDTWEFHREK